MTCKDCVHYGICHCDVHFLSGKQYQDLTNVEEYCKAFKNKANVVEVVRCKDCRYYKKGGAGKQSNYCDCHTTTFEKFFCMPNDYCSKGERK